MLGELIGTGQLLFLRGATFDVDSARFLDRHRLHPLMLDCDAWWQPKTERMLFVNTRPKSEVRFLTFAGLEERAEHEMRISGLSLYRIAGKLPPLWEE